MIVKDLIEALQRFDPNLKVVDDYMYEITEIKETTWVDSNYPYNRPDEQVVVIS